MSGPYDRWTGDVRLEQDLLTPDLFKVCSSLLYRSIDGMLYSIHPGWHTDGGSIPSIFWRFLGPPIRHPGLRAFLLHDILYKSHRAPRDEADRLLYEALINCGVSRWKAKLIHFGVSVGGGKAYDAYDYRAQRRHEQYIKQTRG